MLPVAENSIEKAAQLAAESDVALLFIGLNGEWESEAPPSGHAAGWRSSLPCHAVTNLRF